YNVTRWSCGTVFLTNAYTRLVDQLGESVNVKILPPSSFYPISWQSIRSHFTEPNPFVWKKIRLGSYAIHLWGRVTNSLQPSEGSLVERAFNDFALSTITPDLHTELDVRF